MRTLPICLAVLAAVALTAHADPAQDPDRRYQALLAEAKAQAPAADWLALRIAFSQRRDFRVISRSAARVRMLEAADKGDCSGALPSAKTVLEENYVDIDAHMIAAWCEDAADQGAAARLDRDIGAGLAKSIETVDGLSPANAFIPIDVDEEYALMRALGRKVTGQILVEDGGHSYDSLATVDEKGRVATYYFLVDRLLAQEAAGLQPGAVTEGGPPSRTP